MTMATGGGAQDGIYLFAVEEVFATRAGLILVPGVPEDGVAASIIAVGSRVRLILPDGTARTLAIAGLDHPRFHAAQRTITLLLPIGDVPVGTKVFLIAQG